jgi:hypothetical protein
LVTIGFSILNPMLLIFVPLAFLLAVIEPKRGWLLVIALLLFVTTFMGQAAGVLWWYGRGWALILSAWFVIAVLFLPRASVTSRSLAAVGASTATVALLFLIDRSGWRQLDWAISGQLRTGSAEVAAFWQSRMQDKPWVDDLTSAVYRFTDFQANTYPAMIAIASLAGLTLAWWFWRRLASPERNPLGALRDFRFHNELIWLVIVGAALLVLPLEGVADRTGANLLVFMAALYALRGFAVMIALFGAPTFVGALFGALVFLMLYPVVMATTLMVGLTDTWLDLRARRLTRQDNEKH